MSEPMVKAEGVHKRFGRLEVLKGITLEVEPGEVMCLFGPSGSGKSTFLRCINHLEKIDAGGSRSTASWSATARSASKLHELREARGRAPARRDRHGLPALQPLPAPDGARERDVAPIRVKGVARSEARERGRELLDRVGLADKPRPTRRSSRAASSNAWRSRGRWRCSRS